jgi:hypothetical protein
VYSNGNSACGPPSFLRHVYSNGNSACGPPSFLKQKRQASIRLVAREWLLGGWLLGDGEFTGHAYERTI